jgi:hypothetical protein
LKEAAEVNGVEDDDGLFGGGGVDCDCPAVERLVRVAIEDDDGATESFFPALFFAETCLLNAGLHPSVALKMACISACMLTGFLCPGPLPRRVHSPPS